LPFIAKNFLVSARSGQKLWQIVFCCSAPCTNWLAGWLAGFLVGWPAAKLPGWLAVSMAGWIIGCPTIKTALFYLSGSL